MQHDDGPSSEDIDRFSADTGYCPACGAEIWDLSEFCPDCGEHIGGRTLSRPPVVDFFQQRWIILIAVIVLISFLMVYFWRP